MTQDDAVLLEITKEMSTLTEMQRNTSINVDKLSQSMESLVKHMHKMLITSDEFQELKNEVTKMKEEVVSLQSYGKLSEYRSSRIEKIVYGAIAVILVAVGSGVMSLVITNVK